MTSFAPVPASLGTYATDTTCSAPVAAADSILWSVQLLPDLVEAPNTSLFDS